MPVATASLIAGALALETALVFVALPSVTHALGLSNLIDACHGVLAPVPDDPSIIGWLAAVFAVAIALRFATAWASAGRAARAARAEPWLGRHFDRGDFDLVIVPTPDELAFGVSGATPQVIVSEGLAERLPPESFETVVRHEAAHHRLGHSR